MSRLRLFLVLTALVLIGIRAASAEIVAAPDFPLNSAVKSSENAAAVVLAMYRKDVGIEVPAEKSSAKTTAVRQVVALSPEK